MEDEKPREGQTIRHRQNGTTVRSGLNFYILPDGLRRRHLQARFEQFIAQAFEERVLDFTAPAANAYAEIMGHRKETGRTMGLPDGQIACIAFAHGFAVATRNIKDFEDCGLKLINPFA